MMATSEFAISGLWRGRPQSPEQIAERHLALTDALYKIHAAFRQEWVVVEGSGISYDSFRHDLARAISASIATDDLGVPALTHGYTFSIINTWDKATPLTISISVTDDCSSDLVPANGFVISTSPWPDPTLLAFDVMRETLVAACESFDAECCFAYPASLTDYWLEDDVVDLAWITYVGPGRAAMIVAPPDAIVEYRPDGGLLVAVTRDTFDVNNPRHLSIARDIHLACAPFNAWAKTQKFR